jgi:hypothetical protein
MERAMGYAPHTASERLRVARVLGELPLLEEALERGELAHSAVRELSRIAVPETCAVWLEVTQGKCLREIEAMVSGRRPGDLPTDPTEPRLHRRAITLELSPETYDLWRKLHALAAEEHGQRVSDDELIQALFRRAYDAGRAGTDARPGTASAAEAASTAEPTSKADATSTPTAAIVADVAPADHGTTATGAVSGAGKPAAVAVSISAPGAAGSPAYKIALKQCPDCKRGWQYTGGRDIEVDPAVLECAECDAVHLGSLDATAPERATLTVTPRKREQVLARDGHCCTVPGCRRNVGLDLHHIEYRSRGGDHGLRNLTAICDLHHRAVHFEKLVIRGAAPDQLTFEFRKPRDRRNVTDDDAPLHAVTASVPAGSAVTPAAEPAPSLNGTGCPTWGGGTL